jgi:Tfp pilus assembly protein PilO
MSGAVWFRAGLVALLLVFAAVITPAAAQELVRSEDAVVALFSLQTELTVELRVLARVESRLEQNRRDRDEARRRITQLSRELDELFDVYRAAKGPTGGGQRGQNARDIEAQIERKERDLYAAEEGASAIQDQGRRLRDQIRTMRERMSFLSQQIDTLRASLPTERESVTGVWDIVLLPSGDRGVFALFQTGTMVTGQYVLDGPFQGSLEGTLVDRNLFIQRIDSRLGRSMDLRAFLSPDGQALRGTWENHDLANGQTRTGSWSARRRQPDGSSDDAETAEP